MSVNLLFVALGILLLFVGGEALIRGALGAARRLGISPLLSGLVIVGFGTSSPELAVSVDAAVNQRPDIAVGNVIGSNIGNILLILGLCAVISPMAVKPVILRRDGVVALAAAARKHPGHPSPISEAKVMGHNAAGCARIRVPFFRNAHRSISPGSPFRHPGRSGRPRRCRCRWA